jgi:hypothetical protein
MHQNIYIFMYYIKNAPETLPLPLPEVFENLRFPLSLPLPAPNSLGFVH